MARQPRLPVVLAAILVALSLPNLALAAHATRESTKDIHALGHSPHPATFLGATPATRTVSSDLAFWGKLAFQGNYNGFRVIDISQPDNPVLVSHPQCNGDQGDVVVWNHILVRSWNAPAPAGRQCMGQPVPVGFEGVHVFDVSNPASPSLLTAVEFSEVGAATRGTADGCGSHTATLVPDVASGRLIVYSNNSSGGGRAICNAIDILEIPLANPALASHVGRVPLTSGSLGSNNGCHDAGVILGDVNLLTCASGHAANVFSIGGTLGGTLTSPQFLYAVEEADGFGNQVGVGGRWHSAAFTWDGEVLVLGWEPGGGAAAECEATDPDIKKAMFFYDAATGAKLGQWVLPRAQSAAENCTVHNYNIVPLRSGRYVVVSGNYQAGTWVTDFTNPASPTTIAWSDPAALPPVTTPAGAVVNELGGAWSTYWYNGFLYESDITTGLNVFRVSHPSLAGEIRLPSLNPQTQEFSLP